MRYGLIYSTPGLYDLAMRVLYRRWHEARLAAVADQVSAGDSVVDLCAGTSLLYRALAGSSVDYRAIDINPRFVRALRAKGIEAECLDVASAEIPEADVIAMSSALYHFHPRCGELLNKMRSRARKKVVLVEPVRSNSNSSLPVWGAFARWVGRVDGREVPFHFDEAGLRRLVAEVGGVRRCDPVCGGRDLRVVLDAASANVDDPAIPSPVGARRA